MIPRVFLLFVLCPWLGFAQSAASAAGPLNPDVATLREHIYAGIPDELKHDRWDRRSYHFANMAASSVSDLINSGDIYTDWPELEIYLNRIMQKVLPPELKNDSIIHTYIIADGSYNAFMTPSGSMFINIGLLSEIQDEATLAAVLAHELAHYYKKHSLYDFVKSESGDYRSVLFRNNEASLFSIKGEYEADSLGMMWLQNSGYDLTGMARSMEKMSQREKNILSRYEDKWELKETSHPLPGKREEKFRHFLAQQPEVKHGELFLVSKILFKRLREEAKLKVLENMMATFNYSTCIEKAFKYHLFDPNNPEYIYYLVEAIRRKCYMDATMWHKNFITYRYYSSTNVGDWKVKDQMEDHLFARFNPDLLLISQEEQADIKTMFYWEEDPKFITYEQAFIFYYRVGRALGNNEVILSNALSIIQDTSARNTLLREYLSKDNIRYREYAENLLAGTIWDKLQDRKLTVVNDFEVYIRQGDDNIKLSARKEDEQLLRETIDSTFRIYPDRQLLYLNDIRKSGLSEFQNLSDMEFFSNIHILSKGNQTELHILEPRFWATFQRYGVNEIEFVNCAYLETLKSESTKEAYIHALQTSYPDLFAREKRARDLWVSIGTVREIKDSRMKIPFRTEYSLRFKQPGNQQIVGFLQNHIKEKEEYTIKADNAYRYYLD